MSRLYWPNGVYTSYTYSNKNENRVLNKVQNPGVRKVYYLYEDSQLTDFITGITDELGNRYATYTYDPASKAVTSSEHAGGAGRVDLVYGSDSIVVTDGDGRAKTYQFSNSAFGGRRLLSTDRNGTSTTNVFASAGNDALQRVDCRLYHWHY